MPGRLDGKAVAERLRRSLATRARAVQKRLGRPPTLAVVVRETPDAESYLQSILRFCAKVGVRADLRPVEGKGGAAEALELIARLGAREDVDAILVERPLPRGLTTEALSASLPAAKDAEGLAAANYARFFLAKSYQEMLREKLILPCSAAAVAMLLREARRPLTGLRAAVIGRSSILGRPVAHFLTAMDATVTLVHSRTRNLAEIVRQSDVVVACAGRPRFVRGSWIKPGAIVIDAGINAVRGELAGDVEFEAAAKRASLITPVPGGVGPVTTAILLSQTLLLAERRS